MSFQYVFYQMLSLARDHNTRKALAVFRVSLLKANKCSFDKLKQTEDHSQPLNSRR